MQSTPFYSLQPHTRKGCHVLAAHVAEAEGQDGDSPPRAAPVCDSGLNTSGVDSPPGQVGDLVELIQMLQVKTSAEILLAIDNDLLQTVCGWVARY